jgi:hypothetical protein
MGNGKNKVLRASEINTYLFCQRAWWYQRAGQPSENIAELAAGTKMHYAHGQSVYLSRFIQGVAWLLLLAAIVIAIYSQMH